MSFIDGKYFHFYSSENTVNGGSLHWIQPQCADAYDKLPSMVGSQPIVVVVVDINSPNVGTPRLRVEQILIKLLELKC